MTATEFQSHQFFEKLEQYSSRINETEVRDLLGVEDIAFFDASQKYLEDRIKLTIPTIVQESELTTISQEIEGALNQINYFIGNNSNTGHITNAKNHLFSAISRVRNLPLPFSKNDFNFSKSIVDFEKVVKEKYQTLADEKNVLEESIAGLKSEIETNKTKLSELNSLLTEKENEINNLNSNFTTEFENIRASATQNYESDRTNFRSEFDEMKQSMENDVKEVKNVIEADTNELIKQLNQKLQEAKKIVGVIGDVSVTGNYQKEANNNKLNANVLRLVAIALMVTMSVLLICTIWDISHEDYDWIKSLIRIIAAAALSYPATYAARESSKHRRLEILNRNAELELAAINPFIELLPENKKQEIKEKMVEKYFGNNSIITENQKEDDISVAGLDKILKTILPYLKK